MRIPNESNLNGMDWKLVCDYFHLLKIVLKYGPALERCIFFEFE